MIYVIYGTDTEKAREKAHILFDALKEKKPDAATGTMRAEDVTRERIDELTQTQGLFENKQIIFLDRVLESPEQRDVVLDLIDAIAESPNVFILFEGKLTKEMLKKLEKRAEKVQAYDAGTESKAKRDGSLFALADALGSRDRKALWTLMRNAFDDDAVPEEIHGILFWQAKALALAARTKSAEEAGLNPFVYGKARRFSSNFSPEETDALLSKLVRMYHEAHRGRADFSLELEKLALDI